MKYFLKTVDFLDDINWKIRKQYFEIQKTEN